MACVEGGMEVNYLLSKCKENHFSPKLIGSQRMFETAIL